MDIPDLKEMLTAELGEKVNWILNTEGVPAKERSELFMKHPLPTGWQGVLTMASGLQLDFALFRTGDGWKLNTEPRTTRIG